MLQVVGFVSLAVLVWLNEVLDLPHHLLGAEPTLMRAEEALMESALIVCFGVFVAMVGKKLAARIHQLESYIILCSWCRRVQLDEEWLKLEAYMGKHDTKTSHGICPDCESKVIAESGLQPLTQG